MICQMTPHTDCQGQDSDQEYTTKHIYFHSFTVIQIPHTDRQALDNEQHFTTTVKPVLSGHSKVD